MAAIRRCQCAAKERSGLGTLDLLGTDSRLASWRYTNGRARDAHEFVRSFDAVRMWVAAGKHRVGRRRKLCRAARRAGQYQSTVAASRFARQRWSMVLLGFVLTVATTTAGLVPTYLTVPLMGVCRSTTKNSRKSPSSRADAGDEKKALDLLQDHDGPTFGRLVSLCLLGMAGAAVAAWLLGWAQGVVMSRVSEGIAGDLRNQTYEHLQKLSLDFFGGRLTGVSLRDHLRTTPTDLQFPRG